MFTGLVQAKGTLVRRTEKGADARLVVKGALGKLELGESIAVDGVCLTVAAFDGETFEFDASSETLAKTTLGSVPVMGTVNLERALAVGERLGGHLVSGHVDGVGRVVERTAVGESVKVTFEAPHELARFIAQKGSVCVSGVSLTVNNVERNRFDVMLIPHTLEKTTFASLEVGTKVNLEVDVLARYVARLLEADKEEAAPDSRFLDSASRLGSPLMAPALNIEPRLLERVNGAIADIRAGKMVILVDDEDRENEGDLTMAAQFVTPDAVNFMAMHGRGLICLTLTEETIGRLNLPMMAAPGRSTPSLGTAFTMSVEARHGVTTGISASDRAHTMRLAASPECKPEDLVTPGHVFPLRARKGGVLVRTGQTEGSVDLARLAGLTPAGVICEIMREDGNMARMPDLEVFAQKHGLRILSIADMIQYRLQTERLVKRLSQGTLRLDETGNEWTANVYESATDGRQFVALIYGSLGGNEPILCRMHSGSTFGDVFASTAREGGRNLREAIRCIEAEKRGVIVYLPPRTSPAEELASLAPVTNVAAKSVGSADHPLREFGLGAQVLADLGLHRIKLLTNNPRKIAGLSGFGLEVVDSVSLGAN